MALFRFSSGTDPIQGLLALQQELDRFFENPQGVDLGVSGRGVFPPVNIFSDNDGYVIRLEIPGVLPDQLRVDSEGRTLTVSGKRETGPSGEASFHRRERDSGEFSRSLQLPDNLALDRAQAVYKQGVLTVRVPKKEEAKPRQITVKAV